jgi:hypothetical protein
VATALLLFLARRKDGAKGENMKNTFRKMLLLAVVLGLLAAGQSACGGGGYDSPTAPSTAPGQPTPTPGPGGSPGY